MNRGCGKRKPGGLYICSNPSPHGTPLEAFIIDPPLPYEEKPARAPTIFQRNGTNHLLFWVGNEFYAYPSDFLEEVRRFGASRRVPVDFPIEKLSLESLMFFVHRRAIIENYDVLPPPPLCPKDLPSHHANEIYCLGHSYQIATADCERKRKIGDTVDEVSAVAVGATLKFLPGIFLRLPITDINHLLREDGKPDPRVQDRESEIKIPLHYTVE